MFRIEITRGSAAFKVLLWRFGTSAIFAHIFVSSTMSTQLLAMKAAGARKPAKKSAPPPNKPADSALYKLPYHRNVYFPSDFLLPPNHQIELHHITSNHVFAWKHRFEKELPAGFTPESTQEQLVHAHECVYWLKQEALKHIRKKLKTRMIELTRKHYGELVANITGYTQLTAFLQSEVDVGHGETAFNIVYGKESWPPAWEMPFAELFCKEMNLNTRGDFVTEGRKYKSAVPRLCTYELGQLRARVKSLVRRQKQAIAEDGKKIKRRDKYNVPFDPKLHVKQTSNNSTTLNNNVMV